MSPIVNDQLTAVNCPAWAKPDHWREQTYRVGDVGDKNGMPYTVKGFGCATHRLVGVPPLSREHPRAVWLVVKYRGDRSWKWDCLLIGDTNSFREKLIFANQPHRNPVFTHFVPRGTVVPI